MTCPSCSKLIGPHDGVHITWRHGERIVTHVKCPRSEPTDPAVIASLLDMVGRMLKVQPLDGQTGEQYREARAKNIVQALVEIYDIKERRT